MRGRDPDLTVLIPVHNEAEIIGSVLPQFYREIVVPTGAELLVTEDGSTDHTQRVLEGLASQYPMRLEMGGARKGYTEAVRDGLRHIRTGLVFFADSDGQYDPADFWKLWPHIRDYDMVIGRKAKRDEPRHRIVLSRGFHILAKSFTSVPLKDMDCGFRILRREVVEKVLPEVNALPYSFWAEFTIIAYHMGFRILEVPISHHNRLHGVTATYLPRRLPNIVWRQFFGITALGLRLRRTAGRTLKPTRKRPG